MYCCVILSYLLHGVVLLEKLTGSQLVKKFPAFYVTRRFITAFTSARHLSLSWASSIQSIPPHPTSWRTILISSPHLRLGFPSGYFPLRFPHQNPVYASLLHHTRYMPRQSHSRFYHPNSLGEQYRSLSPSLCNFLHSLVTSSLLGPNIPLNIVPFHYFIIHYIQGVPGGMDRTSGECSLCWTIPI